MFSNLQRPEISYIKVPGNWNDFVVDGKPAGGKGYATYRLILKLPPEIKNKEGFKLGFKLLNPFTSYKFFVNGALFTEIGKVAKTEINSIPFFKPQVISIPLYNQDIEILIHVSNFHYNKAGLIEIIKVGDLIVLQEEREKNLRFDFLLFGSLLLMGIYHLGLFALRQKESYNLYFGLFSILMAIRPFYTGEMYLYSSLPWYLSLKIEYLTFYLGTPIFFLFVFSIFPLDSPKWSKYGIVVLSGLLSLLVIILPVYYFTQTLLPMQLVTLFGIIITFYVMLLAILRKREGGKSFLIGFIVFSLIIANDILNNMSVIHTGYYGPVGFLLFVFSQAFFLSTRSAKAFNLVEEFAETLDAKISDAVEEQKKYSKCILDLNKSNTNAELGLEKALQEVTETCTKTLNVTRTSVWLLDKDSKNLNCVNRFDIISKSHTKGETYHISDYPIYFDYFHSGEILSASNVFEHPAEIEFNENYHSPNNIKSIMEMPIISSGKLLGIVTCEQTYNYRNWSEEEQSFLSSIAGILVGYFEYNERQEAFSQLTETKREVEDLNKFTTIINSLSNLDAIFTEISKHIYNRFGIKGTWLFLSDKNKEYMYAYKAYSYDHVPEEIYNYLKNSKAPLNESGGTIYLVFKRGKPLYFSKIPKFEFEFDKVMVDILKVKSFLYVPLQIKKETIGIMAFANLGEELKLKRKEVNLINNL
ncbi:MAG: GAF domain-containing protein, partial [Leptospiraceae bacterium]|nr:GAF domain-containing protein [Leptospiraceae bacterium]